MIPKILHFAWHNTDLPAWAKHNIDRFRELNPGYIVTVHTPSVLLDRYQALSDSMARMDNRSDLWRYSALRRHGGWWFDVDYWPLRPVDDIVHAYGLDGSKFFVTEQHFQKKAELTTAAGCLAATADSPVWDTINDKLDALEPGLAGNMFGPGLLTECMAEMPDSFATGAWPWFYPAGIEDAKQIYGAIDAGGDPADLLQVPMRLTGGQLPFVMHLWAGGGEVLPTHAGPTTGAGSTPKERRAAKDELAGLNVGVVCSNDQWKHDEFPFKALADGLRDIGCKVQTCVPDDSWPLFSPAVDVIFLWNGRRHPAAMMAGMEAAGVPAIRMELGFFNRHNYTQLDHVGFNHMASWADDWAIGPESAAAGRLWKVWPRDLVPVIARPGRVVVLGQVAGDTQLLESETADSAVLFRAVCQAVGDRADVVYRPHPTTRRQPTVDAAHHTSGTLEEDVAGAAFVVTINSNSGNEALAMGCPVLCLGPALYERAGVARKATIGNMQEGVTAMLDGRAPDPVRVMRYLYRLAARQWSQEELANGNVLVPLLKEALHEQHV